MSHCKTITALLTYANSEILIIIQKQALGWAPTSGRSVC